MKARLFIGLAVAGMALSACYGERNSSAHGFKPYIQNQQWVLPEAYPDQAWVYPAGTSPQAITASWREAGLIMKTYDKSDGTYVDLGPAFYNLPASSQRGLATAVARMYSVSHYKLMDHYRKRPVGIYTPNGLQMY